MAKRTPGTKEALESARRVFEIEAESIRALSSRLNDDFARLVRMLARLPGKVVVSGVGKSGLIGAKVAATLSSTGTPAVFLDPLNALHGDLGIVGKGDVLLLLSNSGEAVELINLIPYARSLGAKIVAFTSNLASTLARQADMALEVGAEREACPLGLAPTASTTTMLAFGDALAMTLASVNQFTEDDFAARHPAGELGHRLRLRVSDLMRKGDAIPVVKSTATVGDALREMTERDNLGVTLVTGRHGRLAGILTDGDIRRMLLRGGHDDLVRQPLRTHMTRNPKTVEADTAAVDALRLMEVKGITSLAIVDLKGRPAGIILLHDILGRGQFSA
ncbi:MAG: KpsF/GutQ family sugar-phosphate isomerase [Planctomycetota bacterium]